MPFSEDMLIRQNVLLPCRDDVLVYQHKNVLLSTSDGELVRYIHIVADSLCIYTSFYSTEGKIMKLKYVSIRKKPTCGVSIAAPEHYNYMNSYD